MKNQKNIPKRKFFARNVLKKLDEKGFFQKNKKKCTKCVSDVVLANSYETILSFAIIIMFDGLGLGIPLLF